MSDAAILPAPRKPRGALRTSGPLVLLGMIGLAVIGGSVAAVLDLAGYEWPSAQRSAPAETLTTRPADLGGLLNTELMPISTTEAERRNALRPADVAAVPAAKPFAVAESFRDDASFRAALDCLTQAIYYEAASEADAGQRAVAQVVLNRVRHPAFPNSVCGVVYQGSELATGCQFSFTCDGSLARIPSIGGWTRARRSALAALSGWVEPAVGLSTHYHAAYVLPYWASSLDKVQTVGAHIFYAMRGGLGSGRAFNARYDFASESLPVAALAATIQPLDAFAGAGEAPAPAAAAPVAVPVLAEDRKAASSRPLAQGGRVNEAPAPTLRADERRGTLAASSDNSQLLID